MALPSKYKQTDNLVKWLASFYDEVSANTAAIAKLNTIIDLTSAVADYALSVGETAKINITAASTPLNIACTDGVYEIRINFNPSSFALDSDFSIQANNAAHAGEFERAELRAATNIATDEVDAVDSAADSHFNGGPNAMRISLVGTIQIRGTRSYGTGIMHHVTAAGVEGLEIITTFWEPGLNHSSLGTVVVSEPATGICYVRRSA